MEPKIITKYFNIHRYHDTNRFYLSGHFDCDEDVENDKEFARKEYPEYLRKTPPQYIKTISLEYEE